MIYREPSKPEEKEMRLSLTRREVSDIVLAYLEDEGRIPMHARAPGEGAVISLPRLHKDHGGAYLGSKPETEQEKDWDSWLCMHITWKE